MKGASLEFFMAGILSGLILACVLLYLSMAVINQENPGSPADITEPGINLTMTTSEPEEPYEDERLASDILITGKRIKSLYEQVTSEISEGDLNGAMLTLNIKYADELAKARSRSGAYHISPEGEKMHNSWEAYLDDLPMVVYRTQMQIENIGKNFYAKAHADKISADKILINAEIHLKTATDGAKMLIGDQAEPIRQDLFTPFQQGRLKT